MVDRIKILKSWVDAVSKKSALNRVDRFLKNGRRPHSIFASNTEKTMMIPKDSHLSEAFRASDLLIPDGVGIVWAARILAGIKLERIAGVEFFFDICELAASDGYGVFIYGAKETTNKTAVDRLKKQFAELKVAGRSNGYVRESEMPNLIDSINESRAEVLFIALGSPKQEKWFAKYHRDLKYVKVCQCIGGTLDTIAGNVKRAPGFWKKYSLEWLYRLIIQPSRIKRQRVLPVFVFAVLLEKVKRLIV